MERSLTEGNSFKQIIWFAFPLLLGNLFQQLYNLADTVIVGKTLGINALASVGASSSLNFLILGFCMGLCSGFAIPVAQTFGAKHYSAMRGYVMNSAILAAGVSLGFALITAVFCRQILILIRTPENILDGAYQYLVIIFIGIPFTVLYNLAAGILRALGDSKSPFIFLAISTVINIFGDLLCILVLHMGVAGAAVATITAQAISGICCLVYMKKRFRILAASREERRPDGNKMKKLLAMGVPMGLQFSITAIGSVMLQSAVNSLGSSIVAAFTAGMKVKQFTMAPFDAIGNTSATFCGQNLGAHRLDRIRKGMRQMLGIAFAYSIVASLALIFLGEPMIRIFVDAGETEVIGYAVQYLRCMGYFFWLLAFLNTTRSAVQGLGHSASAMLAGLLEMVARTSMSLLAIPAFGYLAACFTDQTAWIAATTYIMIDYMMIMKKQERLVLENDGWKK